VTRPGAGRPRRWRRPPPSAPAFPSPYDCAVSKHARPTGSPSSASSRSVNVTVCRAIATENLRRAPRSPRRAEGCEVRPGLVPSTGRRGVRACLRREPRPRPANAHVPAAELATVFTIRRPEPEIGSVAKSDVSKTIQVVYHAARRTAGQRPGRAGVIPTIRQISNLRFGYQLEESRFLANKALAAARPNRRSQSPLTVAFHWLLDVSLDILSLVDSLFAGKPLISVPVTVISSRNFLSGFGHRWSAWLIR